MGTQKIICGDSTIETKMRFKDMRSDIIQLLKDADHEYTGVKK